MICSLKRFIQLKDLFKTLICSQTKQQFYTKALVSMETVKQGQMKRDEE